jgi:redox-sensitive bicupin YhaK (pirin superfamily)
MSTAPLLVIRPKLEDVEGQPILRPLPSRQCRSVGPFVFFDHMLPTHYQPGEGLDIQQHPHIGLSTLTYLFEGELLHKDSLGYVQRVGPGSVSWMTSGHEIAHIERTPEDLLACGSSLHGLQIWLASPQGHDQGEGVYSHHDARELPVNDTLGVQLRMIAGTGFCLASPVPVLSPTLYAEARMAAGSSLAIPTEHRQRAVYLLEGEATLEDHVLERRTLAVLPEGQAMTLWAQSECHLVIIGGAALDGPRRMNWNFVAGDAAAIEEARAKWKAGNWPTVPGEIGRIELPE